MRIAQFTMNSALQSTLVFCKDVEKQSTKYHAAKFVSHSI